MMLVKMPKLKFGDPESIAFVKKEREKYAELIIFLEKKKKQWTEMSVDRFAINEITNSIFKKGCYCAKEALLKQGRHYTHVEIRAIEVNEYEIFWELKCSYYGKNGCWYREIYFGNPDCGCKCRLIIVTDYSGNIKRR